MCAIAQSNATAGVLVPCHLNMAACALRLSDCRCAVRYASRALRAQPENVKALYRRGQAHAELLDFDSALADLRHACGLEPRNRAVRTEFERVLKLEKQRKAKEHGAFRGAFG